ADEPADGSSLTTRCCRGTAAPGRVSCKRRMTVRAQLVDRVARRHGGHPGFTVEFWDGARHAFGVGSEDLVVRLRDRRTCLGLLANPSLAFGDAYTDGTIEVEGDLGVLVERLLGLAQRDVIPTLARRLFNAATSWVPRNSPFRARRNVRYH